jgi:hypothetical protein
MKQVLVIGLVCVAGTAMAQVGAPGEDPVQGIIEAIGTWVPRLVVFAGFLSTVLPSNARGIMGTVMKIIDALALNWGKARNDPASQ